MSYSLGTGLFNFRNSALSPWCGAQANARGHLMNTSDQVKLLRQLHRGVQT